MAAKTEKVKGKKSVKATRQKSHKSAEKADSVDVKKLVDNSKPASALAGHTVVIEYVGTLDNGDVFDESKQHGPITFTIGSGQVIKGFNDAVIGMKVKEKKKIHIPKNEAYGDQNPTLIHKIPLAKLAPELKSKVKVGGFLIMQAPNGQHLPAKVKSLDKEFIVLDLNHPLAGKDLNFEITLLDIDTEAPEDHHGHDHHGHKHGEDGKCKCGKDLEDCECKDGCECGDDCECK